MKNLRDYLLLLIMFWNLENFYSPLQKGEREDSVRVWNYRRFAIKRDLIVKTIMAVKDKEGEFPFLIGLCETDSYSAVRMLVNNTPLQRLGYKIIHRDSPDKRGIDVALLYREDLFKLLETRFLRVRSFRTRDILYAKGTVGEDTLHVFVNHWPSKLGGEKSTSLKRMEVASLLKSVTDSIKSANPSALIVAMGDFNDAPTSEALKSLELNNLSGRLKDSLTGSGSEVKGSHKYRGKWEMLDQFLVSDSVKGSACVFYMPHLLTEDKKYFGVKTRRTFIGPRFVGGASDHLPILLRIRLPKVGVSIE